MPIFLADPCSASFIPSNNITLERNGMTWEYQEQVTGNESVIFRNLIDLQEGNRDNFVNAWEILKAETFLRNQTKETLRAKPDVKLNGTSEPVKVTDVDFCVSKETLGKTLKNSSITNSASVSYIFKNEIGQGTDIWFMGTPNSNATITLPAGFDVERTEGLDNKSQESAGNRIVLKGSFSPEKNITLWISENESSKTKLPEKQGKVEQNTENKSKETENKTIVAGEIAETQNFSGYFKDIFRDVSPWFSRSPKS